MSIAAARLILHGALALCLLARRLADAVAYRRFRLDREAHPAALPLARLLSR